MTRTGEVRPIDFENAHRANATALFDWRSERYSEEETSDDSYSVGAVVYLLLSGQYYDPKHNVPISKHRRRVPFALEDLLKSLLVRKDVSLTVALSKLVEIRDSL